MIPLKYKSDDVTTLKNPSMDPISLREVATLLAMAPCSETRDIHDLALLFPYTLLHSFLCIDSLIVSVCCSKGNRLV